MSSLKLSTHDSAVVNKVFYPNALYESSQENLEDDVPGTQFISMNEMRF